jgi:hypothetical protein
MCYVKNRTKREIVDSLKNILLMFGLLVTVSTLAQTSLEKMKSSFDTIVYYPDSTMKGAYHLKKGLYNGYAIEYEPKGEIVVGKYKKGKKNGVWVYNNLNFTTYKNGEPGLLAIGYYDFEGDRKRAEQYFWKEYWQAVNTGKTNKN